MQSRLRARWARDYERVFTARNKLKVEQNKRESTEMVPVQMRQKDRVYVTEFEAALPPSCERACAEIDNQRASAAIESKASMRATARVEGIARSDKGYAHRGSNLYAFALERVETSPYQRVTFFKSSDRGIRAGRMKSQATRPVMSAIVNVSPAM
jgi:hypothetical protein